MSDPEKLIAAYLDDALAEEDRASLAAWLKAHPDHLRRFVEANVREQEIRLAVAGQVRREAAANFVEAGGLAPAPRLPWMARLWRRRWPAVAAVLLVVLGLALWLKRPVPAGPFVAQVAQVWNMAGPEPADRLQAGQKLRAGKVILTAGALKLTLASEVTIVFEGPGELDLLTPMRVLLHSGQAVARVPEQACGFRIETPGAHIVDLGTEFAVKPGPGLSTDVQVYEGEVVTTPRSENVAGSFSQRLLAGHAARFLPDASVPAQTLPYAPDRFLRRLPETQAGEHQETRGAPVKRLPAAEIVITRAAQPIVVDGDLSEWSAEGGFRGVREGASGGELFEGRARYDADFLYLAAHVGDPAPMRNVNDPATDGHLGWRGGGLQVRLSTRRASGWPVEANAPHYFQFRDLTPDAAQIAAAQDDRLVHLTLWHYAPGAQACLHIHYGMTFVDGVVNPPGYRGAFRKDADGRGYTCEYAIPWSLLHAEAAPPQPGDTLAMTWTAHWSDTAGRLWRGEQHEVRNPAEPARDTPWERAATWGRAVYR